LEGNQLSTSNQTEANFVLYLFKILQRRPWTSLAESNISVRKLFASLIGGESHHCISTAPSTAYAITFAANNIVAEGHLHEGLVVIVMEGEMESNVFPWQHVCQSTGATLCIVPYPKGEETWTRALCSAIEAHPPSTIAVIALSFVHWCSGESIDVAGKWMVLSA
jgi:selenocysteine lyase/cysteine desulfurase